MNGAREGVPQPRPAVSPSTQRRSAHEASHQVSSSRVLRLRCTVVIGILFAIDRRDVRRISIRVRSADTEFLAVLVYPFPQFFTGNPSFASVFAFYTYEIDRQPVAVPSVRASPMVRSVRRSL